jgi:hypothetical protein
LSVRWRILVVDERIGVFAIGQADIAAAAEQDRDTRSQPLDAYFDIGYVLGRRRSWSCGGEKGGNERNSHSIIPVQIGGKILAD